MTINKLLYNINVDREFLSTLILEQNWQYDVPGYISNEELVNLIKNNYFIPQNALLNGRIKMDANNYYAQTGDMNSINKLLDIILLDKSC